MADTRPGVGLAVPLFNEGPLVDAVAGAYVDALEATGLGWRLALVDNGSTDDTRDRVRAWSRRPGVLAVSLCENAGYGGGIQAGLDALSAHDPDYVGWGWGDGQVDPRVVPSLVVALQRGADIAKVRRVSRRDGWQRQVVTRTYARLHGALGTRSADVNGCPKLLTRDVLRAANLQSLDWFLDPELMLAAEARAWTVVELPSAMEARAAGRSKVGWRTAVALGSQVLWWHVRPRR